MKLTIPPSSFLLAGFIYIFTLLLMLLRSAVADQKTMKEDN